MGQGVIVGLKGRLASADCNSPVKIKVAEIGMLVGSRLFDRDYPSVSTITNRGEKG